MVNYKLTYFPIRALAEPARLILHYAKQPFEDNRVKHEDWPAIKPSKWTTLRLSITLLF